MSPAAWFLLIGVASAVVGIAAYLYEERTFSPAAYHIATAAPVASVFFAVLSILYAWAGR